MAEVAKKSKPAAAKGPKTQAPAKSRHENPIKHAAEELEARFLEGAEQATDTTSPETNVVLAAIAAIEGPRDIKPGAKAKATNGKRKTTRSKNR